MFQFYFSDEVFGRVAFQNNVAVENEIMYLSSTDFFSCAFESVAPVIIVR